MPAVSLLGTAYVFQTMAMARNGPGECAVVRQHGWGRQPAGAVKGPKGATAGQRGAEPSRPPGWRSQPCTGGHGPGAEAVFACGAGGTQPHAGELPKSR